MEIMNDMFLVLGDWSDDGHGKTEKVLVKTNKTVSDIQKAYKDSCIKTGLSFHYRSHEERDLQIAAEYEQCNLSERALEIIDSYGFERIEDLRCGLSKDLFIELWMWFVELSLVDFKWEHPDTVNSIPTINGYWSKELNHQFGYGLYE